MESFSSVDIFATKGLEYLLVIGYLMVLVVFWKFLNRPSLELQGAAALGEIEKPNSSWFQLADGFYFHQGHSWAVPVTKDVVKVGVDDFAQKLLGQPESIELPEQGSRIEQGGKGWGFKIDSRFIDMLSPVNGEILDVNEEVLKSPELICTEPYGKGWLMKVKVSNMRNNLNNLISGKLAFAWLEETINKLRVRLVGDLGTVLQDGGTPLSGFVKNLSPEKWDEIAREFLLVE
ncbi:MAG: glycine cleavage system protein H [Candidatus Glassbacteria bacterium]|nr:glycine cleavage system protein H [Candidatus Glassbacteria bacterium]